MCNKVTHGWLQLDACNCHLVGGLESKIPTTLQTPNFIKGILDPLVYDQCFGRPFLVE